MQVPTETLASRARVVASDASCDHDDLTMSTEQTLKPERRCPLEGAHTRLHQSHELWHRLIAAYPDPDEFVLVLNQLLVTLRQVTFMVQKRKAVFDDFDSWYDGWQDRLRAYPTMSWLKDARNHVEKVGDLEIASTARVEIVASWLPGPYSEFEVSPLVSPEEMVSTFPAERFLRSYGRMVFYGSSVVGFPQISPIKSLRQSAPMVMEYLPASLQRRTNSSASRCVRLVERRMTDATSVSIRSAGVCRAW
jgi:hypothetical protein